MTDEQQQMLAVYLLEYEKLKDEQTERIGFRDNLLYVTLGVYGAVLALALGEKGTLYASYDTPYALLVLPWVSLVLGWTYLINDQKITAIGRYIRHTLVEQVSELTGELDGGREKLKPIFGWETAHRSDKRRKRRKVEQLIVDEITFVVSGIMALIAFCSLVSGAHCVFYALSGIELVLLVALGIELFVYADLARGW